MPRWQKAWLAFWLTALIAISGLAVWRDSDPERVEWERTRPAKVPL